MHVLFEPYVKDIILNHIGILGYNLEFYVSLSFISLIVLAQSNALSQPKFNCLNSASEFWFNDS